jgi:translocation and assembly module TamA
MKGPGLAKFLRIACLLLLVLPAVAFGDVRYVVKGLGETLEANVLSYVDTVQIGPQARFRPKDHDKVIEASINKARAALRPFGYYLPEISARIIRGDNGSAVVELTIDAGRPVRVSGTEIRVTGPGSKDRRFRSWLNNWPLPEGAVLSHVTWEEAKQEAIDIADDRGYLGAEFSEHVLEIDLDRNVANLRLVLDTGPRYVMGEISFGPHMLKPDILEYVPRFEKGDFYTAELISRLRTDLWRTGYFDDISVVETRRPELNPPAVDFDVQVKTETKNEYSGALGWGDATGIRLQANYTRVPISSYGDRLDLGIGYQELDNQFTLRGRYLKPLRNRARKWWDAEITLRYESIDLDIKIDTEDEDAIRIASGDLQEEHYRFGRLQLRNFKGGEAQHFTTPFVQYLNNNRTFDAIEPIVIPLIETDSEFDEWLRGSDSALSIGYNYEVVDVQGRGFHTEGDRYRAWVFYSDEAFGSTVEFTQLYLATRHSYIWTDNLKIHFRAELGYTDAEVINLSIQTANGPIVVEQTRLPHFYRFKAGGSMSVRGYGFEELSNNDVGSNNILTGSAEIEYRFLNSWSASAFFDIGNAFNDWDNSELKRGIGVGLRWYSFAGEIRVDVAQALDYEGKPWRWHLTIGTPLL